MKKNISYNFQILSKVIVQLQRQYSIWVHHCPIVIDIDLIMEISEVMVSHTEWESDYIHDTVLKLISNLFLWSSPQSVLGTLRAFWKATVSPAPSTTSTQTGMSTGFTAPAISQMGLSTPPRNRWTEGAGWLSRLLTWAGKIQTCPTTVPWGAPDLVDTLRALWFILDPKQSGLHSRSGMELDHRDLWGHFCVFQSYSLLRCTNGRKIMECDKISRWSDD